MIEPTEKEIHCEVTKWLRDNWTTGWVHVAPEGQRSARQGRMRKLAGVSTGYPDLMCYTPKGTPDIAIELKTITGRLSPAQLHWEALLLAAGCQYYVCRSSTEAIRILEDVLLRSIGTVHDAESE